MTAIKIFNTSHHTLPPATLSSAIESSFLWAHHPQFEWDLDFGALTVMDSNTWETSNPIFFFYCDSKLVSTTHVCPGSGENIKTNTSV